MQEPPGSQSADDAQRGRHLPMAQIRFVEQSLLSEHGLANVGDPTSEVVHAEPQARQNQRSPSRLAVEFRGDGSQRAGQSRDGWSDSLFPDR